jgi:hypothetical protein
MKSLHISLSAVLLSLAVAAAAQSTVQKSFEQLKTLASRWETTVEEKALHDQITLRVISMGHTFVFEVKSADKHSD